MKSEMFSMMIDSCIFYGKSLNSNSDFSKTENRFCVNLLQSVYLQYVHLNADFHSSILQ